VAEKRVNPQVEERDESEGEVGLLSDFDANKVKPAYEEIEVDPVQEVSKGPGGVPHVVVRVNSSIEEMSMVGGGKAERYTFEEGHQYRVPWYIAQELERTGKVWH